MVRITEFVAKHARQSTVLLSKEGQPLWHGPAWGSHIERPEPIVTRGMRRAARRQERRQAAESLAGARK